MRAFLISLLTYAKWIFYVVKRALNQMHFIQFNIRRIHTVMFEFKNADMVFVGAYWTSKTVKFLAIKMNNWKHFNVNRLSCFFIICYQLNIYVAINMVCDSNSMRLSIRCRRKCVLVESERSAGDGITYGKRHVFLCASLINMLCFINRT